MMDIPIWQMIKEAIEVLDKRVSYSDIREYIESKWGEKNQATVTAQIIVLTVNHNSRIHYPENFKPRVTDSNHRYDILFSTGRGEVEKYCPEKHGAWEIFENSNKKLAVRLLREPNEALKIF